MTCTNGMIVLHTNYDYYQARSEIRDEIAHLFSTIKIEFEYDVDMILFLNIIFSDIRNTVVIPKN